MQLYFDCFSGISGDMTLGALIDLGVPQNWLEKCLAGLPLSGFNISISTVLRNGISSKNVKVLIEDDEHSRNFAAIKSMIEGSSLSSNVKNSSLEMFGRIADAESKIHGCPKDRVHFHEVGGIDAIVDIVGTCLCIEYLGVKKITSSHLPLGMGFVKCQHGKLPVPVPATVSILKNIPVYGTTIENELVTPTGAAIISTLAESFGPIPKIAINKIGYGAGQRINKNIPNLLRVVSGKAIDNQENLKHDNAIMVETCIDDMNPEIFSFVMERLFEMDVLDIWWTSVYMKKNRPGTMVQVLCTIDTKDAVVHCLLSETSSIGVRFYNIQRTMLHRKKVMVETEFGTVQAKQVTDLEGKRRIIPEYEVCKALAIKNKISFKTVYDGINNDGRKYIAK